MLSSPDVMFSGAGSIQQHDAWQGTFSGYVELVRANPLIAENAHHRLWRMVAQNPGPENGRPEFGLFVDKLFGLDRTCATLTDEYLRPAARGFELRKRILLLVGPVSGGKSSLVTILKEGLEEFTASERGQLFGIRGCPMHEEPLHLVPESLRAQWATQLGVVIEGRLCPVCAWKMAHEWAGHTGEIPVERVVFSEQGRIGIGTYAPSDPKSQDIADLTGAVDFDKLSTFGSESDPRAFRFDGELNIANRGIVEFQEMLKLDEKFLYQLLSLSQEGYFKTSRYQLISADEVIIGHTNEHEFRTFVQNPRNAALLSRMFVLAVPYSLNVSDEVRIYQKLLLPHQEPGVHLAPGALEAAATVAVLSRLKDQGEPGRDRMSKLALYQSVENDRSRGRALDEARALGEGMSGLDPRYIINRLARLFADPSRECIDALDVLESLQSGMETSPFADRSGRAALSEWIQSVKGVVDRRLEHSVMAAFSGGWGDALDRIYHNYLDHVVRCMQQGRYDENLLSTVEERIGVNTSQAMPFREEIYARLQAPKGEGIMSLASNPPLQRALEAKLFDDMRDIVKITTESVSPDAATLGRIEAAASVLVAGGQFCPRCAARAIHHVGGVLNR